MKIFKVLSYILSGIIGLIPNHSNAENLDIPDPVRFKVMQLETDGSKNLQLLARYGQGTEKLQFKIIFEDDFGISTFSKGTIYREKGFDGTPFLKKLEVALQAEANSFSQDVVDKLPFAVTVLGALVKKSSNILGGFTDEPGAWIATKIFLAEGEGEVYFNFNTENGDAEFSIKDKDYGNVVIKELSKVLK